jgi:hypothetical protein
MKDDHNQSSYLQSFTRWYEKRTGTINDEQLAGIGNDRIEREKTKTIINDYFKAIEKGEIIDKQKFCSRLLPIVITADKIICDLIKINNTIKSPNKINQEELISEIHSILAKAELLTTVQTAIPQGMATLFIEQKNLAETNFNILKNKQLSSQENQRISRDHNTEPLAYSHNNNNE